MFIAVTGIWGDNELVVGRFMVGSPTHLSFMPSFQLIFFVMGLVCALPVVFWYYRRNSHPKFRPKFGEMAMVILFVVLLSLGGSLLIGGLMDDPEQFTSRDGFSAMPSKVDVGADARSGNQREQRKESSGDRNRSGSAGESRGQDRR